jgi:hypothetical protein
MAKDGSDCEKERRLQDALPNGNTRDDAPQGPWSRVAGMQANLHR